MECLRDGDWDVSASERVQPLSRNDERVQRILGRLPARYREVLTCRFLLNYSIRETAVWMGLAETNVSVL